VGGIGIVGHDGASLTVESCAVSRNTAVGIIANGPGTAVELLETTVDSTKKGELQTVGIGISAQDSATIEATRVTAISNEGPGVYVVGEELAYFACLECELRNNQFAGAAVLLDGSLVLDDSHIEGTTEQENLGGGVGIYVDGFYPDRLPFLEVHDTTIQDNPIAGVWLSAEGSIIFSSNFIHGRPFLRSRAHVDPFSWLDECPS